MRINESLEFDTVLQGVLDSARSLTGDRYRGDDAPQRCGRASARWDPTAKVPSSDNVTRSPRPRSPASFIRAIMCRALGHTPLVRHRITV